MMLTMRYIISIVLIFAAGCAQLPSGITRKPMDRFAVHSPDGKITLAVGASGPLSYGVRADGKTLVTGSQLGMTFTDGKQIGRDVQLLSATGEAHDSMWEDRYGKQRHVRDHYNELKLSLRESSGQKFDVVFRAYDDGVAFRYLLPKEQDIQSEDSHFALLGYETAYAGEQGGGVKGSQEWQFKPRKLSLVKDKSTLGTPVLVNAVNCWIAIGESDLRNYAGMWLSGDEHGTLKTKLSSVVKGAKQSPWRVIMIGRRPGDLIESNLIANLATPKVIDDSWVKPGMMAWDHWWIGNAPMNTQTLKQCIDLAADNGWPYQLIDEGWAANHDVTKVVAHVDLPELLRYAKEKNVRLWLWMHWTDVDRNDKYKEAFPLFEKWGIAGVKIDFMDRDDQQIVNWYEKITRAAAEHHLMIDFHGSFKPAGFNRTFPNQITREGILGNEYNKVQNAVTMEHKLMLPFTRFLEGPADFTPGGFRNRWPRDFKPQSPTLVQGSRTAELALYVLYDSPVCCNCDAPETYANQPGMDFLRVVPTVWDETKVIEGEPGQYLTMARRSGDKWFIGSMSDQPREVQLKLNFLAPGKWKMTMWKDATDGNAEHLEMEQREVTSGQELTLPIRSSGGCVMMISH